jgi:UDP-N-acetylglucosamine transferase subunit ALG13
MDRQKNSCSHTGELIDGHQRVEREVESLNGAIIDDAYDGTGVLNRPNRASVVIMSKEDCDEIVDDHNQALSTLISERDALRAENERLRNALRELSLALEEELGTDWMCKECNRDKPNLNRLVVETDSDLLVESTQPAPDQKGKP